MPAGERVQYLERLGALTPPTPDSQVSHTNTTASENWTKLRDGWHQALHAELHSFRNGNGEQSVEELDNGGWNKRMRRESFWKMIADNYKLKPNVSAPTDVGDHKVDEKEVVEEEVIEVVHVDQHSANI
jgi:hypothetical protein